MQQEPDPEDPPNGDWAFEVRYAEKADDTHVSIGVITKDDDYADGYRSIIRFQMAHLGDDQYVFEDIMVTLVHLGEPTQMEGTFTAAPIFNQQDGRMGGGSHIALTGDILYYIQNSSSSMQLISISGSNASTLQPVYEDHFITLNPGESYESLSTIGDQLVLATNQQLLFLSADLVEMQAEPLPAPILATRENWASVSVSPDGRWYNYLSDEGSHLYSTETGEVTLVASHPNFLQDGVGEDVMAYSTVGIGSWSADSRTLFFSSYGYETMGAYFIYDTQTGQLTDLSEMEWGYTQVGVLGEELLFCSPSEAAEDLLALNLTNGATRPIHCAAATDESEFYLLGGKLYRMDAAPIPETETLYDRLSTLYTVDVTTGEATPVGFTAKGAPLLYVGSTAKNAVFQYCRPLDPADNGFVSIPLL